MGRSHCDLLVAGLLTRGLLFSGMTVCRMSVWHVRCDVPGSMGVPAGKTRWVSNHRTPDICPSRQFDERLYVF